MAAPAISARVGFVRAVGIVENERVEIAVAGVKNVRDLQVVLGADLAYARQRVRQLR